jgi:hypothetical protein
VARRRRNKLVVAQWSPQAKREHASGDADWRHFSIGRTAIGAALLLGTLILLFSSAPVSSTAYRRNQLATFICESAGVEPGTAQCAAVSIAGWFVFVVALGVVLKIARISLKAAGFGTDKPLKDREKSLALIAAGLGFLYFGWLYSTTGIFVSRRYAVVAAEDPDRFSFGVALLVLVGAVSLAAGAVTILRR